MNVTLEDPPSLSVTGKTAAAHVFLESEGICAMSVLEDMSETLLIVPLAVNASTIGTESFLTCEVTY